MYLQYGVLLGIFFTFGSVTGIFNLRGDHIYGYKRKEEEENQKRTKRDKKKKKGSINWVHFRPHIFAGKWRDHIKRVISNYGEWLLITFDSHHVQTD